MKQGHVIEAGFHIVTPMFLGSAEHEASRIRGPAIKGALAFWWRAFHFARFVDDANGDVKAALRAMRCRERDLFGSAQNGQGIFLLRVEEKRQRIIGSGKVLRSESGGLEGATIGVGARYLGYGVINAFHTKATDSKPEKNAGELERACIRASGDFVCDFIFRPTAEKTDIESILKALKLFGLLGGLGARVRRGWGALALRSLKATGLKNGGNWRLPGNRDEYCAALRDIFKDHPGKIHSGRDWPLTAFAKESQIRVGRYTDKNALVVLNDIGGGFLKYRGWRNGDKNFKADHDWYKMKKGVGCRAPKRTAFGLPHNYAKWLGITAPAAGGNADSDRRASPLMFHIHQGEDGKAFPVVVYCPVSFTPGNKVAVVKNGNTTTVSYDFFADGDPVVRAFLSGNRPDGTAPGNGSYFKSDKVLP